MLIDITDILKTKGTKRFSFREPFAEVERSIRPVLKGDPEIEGSITCDEDGIFVSGHVKAVMIERCSRCLDELEYPIDLDFEGQYSETEDIDEGIYGYQSSAVEIDKAVLDAVSLELPEQYLCREDCKGLCPVCGVNRNREKCDCDTLIREDNPFSKLKDLFNTEEE